LTFDLLTCRSLSLIYLRELLKLLCGNEIRTDSIAISPPLFDPGDNNFIEL